MWSKSVERNLNHEPRKEDIYLPIHVLDDIKTFINRFLNIYKPDIKSYNSYKIICYPKPDIVPDNIRFYTIEWTIKNITIKIKAHSHVDETWLLAHCINNIKEQLYKYKSKDLDINDLITHLSSKMFSSVYTYDINISQLYELRF